MNEQVRSAIWQPIDSAPRDGTKVDLWVDDYGFGRRLTDCEWAIPHPFMRREECWCVRNGEDEAHSVEEFGDPTHWMPLPDPPA